MKQSRGTSFLKSLVSTVVGFAVAMVANALVLPLFGFTPSLSENFLITCIYTVISVARGYALERAFEALGWRTRMSAFALAALAERQRQTTHEGYTVEHDDELKFGVLTERALDYMDHWHEEATLSERRRSLVKAGALIIAEGEKFDRARTRPRNEARAA
jgi:hypothetical protein